MSLTSTVRQATLLQMIKTNYSVIRFGFGMDIWDIPFDNITKFYKVG